MSYNISRVAHINETYISDQNRVYYRHAALYDYSLTVDRI